jgi:hypothetical protein
MERDLDHLRVEAHAGASYPERPEWVTWKGRRAKVETVEGQWREPGRLLFRVRLEDGRRLLLAYRESDDSWAAVPAFPGSGTASV